MKMQQNYYNKYFKILFKSLDKRIDKYYNLLNKANEILILLGSEKYGNKKRTKKLILGISYFFILHRLLKPVN